MQVFEQFEKTLDIFLDTLNGQRDLDLTADKVPLYGRIWPSALALSEFFMKKHQGELHGKRVLEIGCGLALPSIVASRMGAEVVATDYLAEIGDLLSKNMQLNAASRMTYELCDYRYLSPHRWSPFDFILASEVTYEKKYFAPLIDFLQQTAHAGATIYLADPLRTHHSELVKDITACGKFTLTHVDMPMITGTKEAICRILCLKKC